jgi:structural maintenance of chromosome 3 (chondroitin sulfate proteoglycan 6)
MRESCFSNLPSLDTTSSKLRLLYAKQGRSRQFASQAERDANLGTEIKNLQGYEKQQQKRIANLQQDVEGAKANLAEVAAKSEEQARGEDEQRDVLKQMSEEVSKLKTDQDNMQEKRK